MREANLVYNERIKALAGLMHNLATASIVSGVIAPLLAANSDIVPDLRFIVTIPVGIAFTLAFGFLGQIMLKDLRG